MLLRVNGRLHPLAQIGPDRIVLCEAAALPEGPAEIIMHVDDATERWEVDLHQADPAECGVPIRLRD